MRRILAAAATGLLLVCGAAGAEDAPSLAALLGNNTLAAVMFLPHAAPKGGGSLDRIMFQAYLRPNGSALIRRWDAPHDAYTVPAEAHWSVTGSTLCLNMPGLANAADICLEVHVWGPRIAGNTAGGGQFALLDGNIEPGNSLIAAR